jgi:hypothetical protein
MVGVRSQTVVVSVQGDKALAFKLGNFSKAINSKQLTTGTAIINRIKRRAQNIIRMKKAPVTSGQLENTLQVAVNQTGPNRYTHELFTDVRYARKVHSGFAPYMERNLTPNLLQWIEDNLGVGARKAVERRGYIRLGHPSGKRKYSSQEGMRFFDIPFGEAIGQIPEEYRKAVEAARLNTNI